MNFKSWLLLTENIMIKDQEFRDPLLALQQIRKNHPNPENLAVTYTAFDKIGLNPKNKYDTPLGIYLYPLDYVIENKLNVPFAGDQPHINVCEFTKPHKILQMTSDVSNQRQVDILPLLFPKQDVDQASKSIDKYKLRSNYSKLWLMTKILSDDKPTQWNANLRKCGIDGFVDHGTGTIHSNEPTQCVVFSANALKLLHSINNPIFNKKTTTINTSTQKYDIGKMSDEQIIRMLQSHTDLNIQNFFKSEKYTDRIAELIIKYKVELSTENITVLLHKAIDRDKIAESIINKKQNISIGDISYLLHYAINKEKIAELIGTDNISKLPANNIAYVLKYSNKTAQIINKYHKNKTPKIQQIIDKALEPQTFEHLMIATK